MRQWTIKDSAELYNIAGWSSGYFRVNDAGHVEATPLGMDGRSIDLYELVLDLQRRGLGLPLLVRFSDILDSRVRSLVGCFESAIRDYGFRGRYRGVYPIKVNQQHQVVEELVNFGRPYGIGLEAGSKPELLAGLALLDNPEALLILNGYKDVEYMETALLAQKLGRHPIVVIDRYRELDLLLQVSRRLGIRPHIAVRAIKDAMKEACRVFVELSKAGAGLKFIDVGGGLGVDYDGSQTNWQSSTNYTMQEYANDVVAAVLEACERSNVPHPDIVSESGRALVAHHSVLVFDVLDVNEVVGGQVPPQVGDDEPPVI